MAQKWYNGCMLRELIVDILYFNRMKEEDELLRNVESDSPVILHRKLSEASDAESSFLITDKREIMMEALDRGIGVACYLNDYARSQDFSDVLYCISDLGRIPMLQFERMYRRAHNIPWEILSTDRLTLYEMCEDDVDVLYEIYDHPDVGRYAGVPIEDRTERLHYIRDYSYNQYRFFEYGIWLVKEKTTGKVIGRAGITNREEYDDPEIGYVFSKKYWNKGYASEAIKAIIDYASYELELTALNAFVIPENVASIHILDKFGFARNGQVTINDELHDWYRLDFKGAI